jgi:[acyl-carrier-protein] S-malonyltransferase
MSFADALKVVDERGRAMQACGEKLGGTMAAVLGLDRDALDEVCASVGNVWPANYNSPGQIVISGGAEAVREAGEVALGRGAKKVMPLAVGGAFHTPFMAGAALSGVQFTQGGGASFFSTTEVRYAKPNELAGILAGQLMSPVRFTQSIQALVEGVNAPDRALEVGPGNVLGGLVKRIARDLPVAGTGDAQALQKALEAGVAD